MTDRLRELVDEAHSIVTGARRSAYGTPERNFERIARLWNAHLRNVGILEEGGGLMPGDVALLVDLMKTARLAETPDHRDSIVDKIGYALCYADCVGDPVDKQVGGLREKAEAMRDEAVSDEARAYAETTAKEAEEDALRLIRHGFIRAGLDKLEAACDADWSGARDPLLGAGPDSDARGSVYRQLDKLLERQTEKDDAAAADQFDEMAEDNLGLARARDAALKAAEEYRVGVTLDTAVRDDGTIFRIGQTVGVEGRPDCASIVGFCDERRSAILQFPSNFHGPKEAVYDLDDLYHARNCIPETDTENRHL